jgi:hypothetical protein
LSAQFAMVISSAPAVSAGHGGGETPSAETGGLLAQAAAGPGFWEDQLGELRREGLIAELLADGVIAKAVAEAEHGHKLNRALTAEVTAMCVLVGALFPDQGYDMILARTFAMPGLPVKPGTVTPSGPALSKARVLLGEQAIRRIFQIDAARTDAELGARVAWHGMETTAIDGTTMELFSNDELAEAFGVPSGGTKPKLRMAAHVRTGSRRWIAAAVGGYLDGENALADELEESFTGGILNTADRGSSPWTGGSGSPPAARTWPGGSRTARSPSRSRPSRRSRTGRSWCCCASRTPCSASGACGAAGPTSAPGSALQGPPGARRAGHRRNSMT